MKKIFKYLLIATMALSTMAFAKDTSNELKSLEKTFETSLCIFIKFYFGFRT